MIKSWMFLDNDVFKIGNGSDGIAQAHTPKSLLCVVFTLFFIDY